VSDNTLRLLACIRSEKSEEKRTEYATLIYNAIEEPLARYVYSRIVSSSAEDILQEIALAIVKGLEKCRATTAKDFRIWYYRIARNKVADHLRKKMSDKLESMPSEFLEAIPQNAKSEADVETYLDLFYILALIEQLKPGCRKLIWDFHILEMEQKVMAEEYDIEVRAIGQRISRCFDAAVKLANRLKGKDKP
jgi:RNA polymerase sigma factor (sigma-70 family)